MTCRPHHAACPQGEACTCERTSPDDPYRMHGSGHEPAEDDSRSYSPGDPEVWDDLLRLVRLETQEAARVVVEISEEHAAEVCAARADGYRAGQREMRERAAALCDMRSKDHWLSVLSARDTYTRDTADAMSSEAEQCAEAIRALEVQP